MQNLQEIFDQIKALSKEQKTIRAEYRDALLNTEEYQITQEKLTELKNKKKELETMVQNQMGSRYEKLEEIKAQLAELKQTQSDIAMNQLMKGQNIEVKDEYDNLYEPQFVVNFKKTGLKKPTNNSQNQTDASAYSTKKL